MPALCCSLTVSASTALMRPSALRVGSSTSLRERHRAAERAAGDAAGDVDRRAARALEADGVPAGIVRIGGRDDRRRFLADDERLAAADEHVDLAVALFDRADVDVLRELVDEQVALVEQVVGRLVGARVRGGNLVVEVGNALRERRDFGRLAGDRAFDLLAELAELRVVGLIRN